MSEEIWADLGGGAEALAAVADRSAPVAPTLWPGRAGPRAGMLLPDYGGACIDRLGPALLAPRGRRPAWLPRPLVDAEPVVLLVLDGLGWLQLRERRGLVPLLADMEGGPITTVVPTTTSTALSSLSLGMAPAAHGIVGYKFAVAGPTGKEILNVLRWSTASGDARGFAPPPQVQPRLAFGGRPVPVVSRVEFTGSGFSQAHQRGAREMGWAVPSSLPVLVARALAEGESFVYAYYDGIDKVAHASGFGPLYDAELVAVDRLVSDLLSQLPRGAALAVTADHGQVDVGPKALPLDAEVAGHSELMSGEARFRWLHSAPGASEELLERARAVYGESAWVAPRDEVVGSGVLGGVPSEEALRRLGDVVVVPLGEDAYLDPLDGGEAKLVCRHGGLSSAEVLVPLLSARS
ncbi:MAG TPA: alkaline phosphatase family protein [Acidimicrobiales bacterium]|nr:alkaline phosphatase family protein [Acidimicrobiales bacterium]